MARYTIKYDETTRRVCHVDANSCSEATEKFKESKDIIDDYHLVTIDEEIKHVYLDE